MRNPNGNGLGLSICRNVANNLGGDLTFHSTIGEGCTFVFAFEAAPTQGYTTPTPNGAPKSAQTKKKKHSKKLQSSIVLNTIEEENEDLLSNANYGNNFELELAEIAQFKYDEGSLFTDSSNHRDNFKRKPKLIVADD